MTSSFVAACVQMTAAPEFEANALALRDLVRRARDAGADLVLTPENTGMLEPDQAKHRAKARDEADHPVLAAAREVAAECGVHLVLGSIAVRAAGDRLANRSYLLSPRGETLAAYDKIHLFEATLGVGESYREGNLFAGGGRLVAADLPWGRIGLTICYDLRFPELYRTLARDDGASFLTVPSAFTVPTGRAHWHILLRARAIECGAFVFAPAQVGEHAGGRRTYGHSLIVGPWGEVLADAGDAGPGIVTARIDPGEVSAARERLPSLHHDRPYGRG